MVAGLWLLAGVLFVVGWIFQFVGHAFERNPPEFFKEWRNSRDSAYPMIVERVRLAQEHGVVRGILFHQGESDTGNSAWVGKVEEIVADLRAELGLMAPVPFVAGELLYSGCCAAHNPLVQELPGAIGNAHVVSAADLTPMDNAHFDLASQRELGRRYAEAMLAALGEQ